MQSAHGLPRESESGAQGAAGEMALRLGLITAEANRDWHAGRLMRAMSVFGEAEVVDPSRLRVVCGRRPGQQDLFRLWVDEGDARRFDAVILGRVVGPRADGDVQLDGARAFELLEIPLVNPVGAMLRAQDKLWTAALLARAGVPTPPCSSVPLAEDVPHVMAEIGPGVAKPLFGSLGEGIFRCDSARGRTILSRRARGTPLLVQRFVATGGVDYRLFVVGDQVEACVRREAPPGGWRSNAVRGGRVSPCVARPSWTELAIEAARALGLEVAGVDLAVVAGRPTVLEVNGFPNFRAVHRATGRDMAVPIARRAAELARSGRRRRARIRADAGGR